MIKFFRAIRQNLLNEGKTTKYLKYAIGEIVLVMIGILLALQVNNWNNNRQLKQKEKKILIELRRNLVSNDSILQQEIKLQQTITHEITTTIEHLKSKKPYNDTISSYLSHIVWIERIQFVSSAYESLKSIGLDIISSDLVRADISNLFSNEFPIKMDWIRDAGQTHADLLRPYYVKFFEYTFEPFQTKIENYNDDPTQAKSRLIPDYKNLLLSQEFINEISQKRSLKFAIIAQLKELQVSVKKTINEIDKELETF